MKKNFLITAIIVFSALTFALKASAQLKGDSWIFSAYQELYHRQPNAWELNIHNYNNGSWNNYDELRRYVKMYQISLRNNNLTVSTTMLASGNLVALFNQNGISIAADLITNDGGSIIAQGGGNIVAQGGGNVISTNGSNFVDLKGVSFGSKYQTLSVGTTIIPASGNGALIIR